MTRYLKSIPLSKWILIILISIISSFGLCADMSFVKLKLSAEEMNYSLINRLLTIFSSLLSTNTYAFSITFLLVFLVILIFNFFEKSKRQLVISSVIALLVAITEMIGYSFDKSDSFKFIFYSTFVLIRAVFYCFGVFVFVFCLTNLFYTFLDKAGIFDSAPSNVISDMSSKKLLKNAAIIFVCWLPYLILLYPGTASSDTSTQILMFLDYHNPFIDDQLKLSAVTGPDIHITNHHPYFTSVIFGLFAKIGLGLFGNINVGIVLYSVFQMLCFSIEYSVFIRYFHRIGLKDKGCKGLLIVFALFPFFPMMAICMVKDTLFALTYIPFSMMCFELMRTKGEALNQKRFLVLLMIFALLMTLTKQQGVYFLFVIMIIYLIYFRKKAVKILITLIIPVLFYVIIWSHILLPALHVAPGGKQEMMGLMFQHTARYVTKYPKEVTEEEKKSISSVLDYDRLPELYKSSLHDPVKVTFNQNATGDMLKDYYKTWFSMFKKHPSCYVEATIANCYSFFYMNQKPMLYYINFKNRVEEGSEYFVKQPSESVYSFFIITRQIIRRLPLLATLYCESLYVLLTISLLGYNLYKKKYKNLLAMIFTILSVGILLICPQNGNMRYYWPMIFLIIPNILISIYDGVEENDNKVVSRDK